MKNILIVLLLGLVVSACGPKAYYETSVGKKKLRHYNQLQFGQENKR